tara:strand:+ start:79677 stop:81665 length:1989 start_codon:yes stop_codon:yes gene_type:complete
MALSHDNILRTNIDKESKATIRSGMTKKALVIGVVMSVLLNLWTIHAAYVTGSSYISLTHLPIAALFPFLFVLLVLNPVMKVLWPSKVLNRHELIIIFFLVFTASTIPAWPFTSYWISAITAPYYYATTENQWAELFFSYLPSWLIISDDQQAITWFFEGVPERNLSLLELVRNTWMIPLFWWMTFFLSMFVVGASAMVMLRKQWVEHERLPFPLAQIPLILVEEGKTGSIFPAVVYSKLFWYGFGLTLFILIWNIVGFFNWVSAIPIGPMHTFPLVLARSFPAIPIKFNFLVAGVGYFTNLNVLFSIWVFFLIMVVQQGIMTRLGLPKSFAVVKSQHSGGFLVFSLFALWAARRHLRNVFMKAIGKAPHVDDSKEFFSYRMAVLGSMGGIIYIVCWLYASGMSLGIIAFLIGSLLLMFVGVTRIVAETGIMFLDLPFETHDFTVAVVGSGNIGAQDLTNLAIGNAYARNWRTLGMCSMGHIAKVDDEMGGTGKGSFSMITTVLALSIIVAVVYTVYLGYTQSGASNFLEPAFKTGSKLPYDNLTRWINNEEAITGTEFWFMAIGGLATALLIQAHYRFTWWPLHPIGFAVAMTPGMVSSIFSIFVVWFVKALLLKMGGSSLYQRGIPAVIGMIIAFVLGVFLSYLSDWIWFPQAGHPIQTW